MDKLIQMIESLLTFITSKPQLVSVQALKDSLSSLRDEAIAELNRLQAETDDPRIQTLQDEVAALKAEQQKGEAFKVSHDFLKTTTAARINLAYADNQVLRSRMLTQLSQDIDVPALRVQADAKVRDMFVEPAGRISLTGNNVDPSPFKIGG